MGATVLEIGAGVGAAVVYASASLEGAELEIRAHGTDWDGTHVGVRRRGDDAAVWAAVFGGLREGRYEVRQRGEQQSDAVLMLEVTGGTVTEAALSG